MPRLEPLHAGHADALLAFERDNRAYFAAHVPDRGDDYFTHFAARHAALLAEQAAGICRFHVLVDDAGAIVGRVNLVDLVDGGAELGFRIAEKAAGKGLATTAVQQVCTLAATAYGLNTLHAAATVANTGSRTVLTRNGFTETGTTVLDGHPALRFTRPLAPPAPA
ncbi:GNAT family N-acetyltransferase [Streptomyces pristinaespiralis]|uniref:GNAT family N-acetyltransferase n=1 Tax=Streptomyces pristinaespiralis TaxID=38300 RepID=UPI0034084696